MGAWSAGLGLVAGLLLAAGSLASWWHPVGGGYAAANLKLRPWARSLIMAAAVLYVVALVLLVIEVWPSD